MRRLVVAVSLVAGVAMAAMPPTLAQRPAQSRTEQVAIVIPKNPKNPQPARQGRQESLEERQCRALVGAYFNEIAGDQDQVRRGTAQPLDDPVIALEPHPPEVQVRQMDYPQPVERRRDAGDRQRHAVPLKSPD